MKHKNELLNLIPQARIDRRKRYNAIRRWGTLCAISAFVCSLPLIAIHIAPEVTQSMVFKSVEQNQNRIKTSVQSNDALKKRLSALTIRNESVAMLERRVEWGGIFRAISVASDDKVWLKEINCGSDDENEERIVIDVTGFALTQGDARTFVVSLENLGLFDAVVLSETSRVMFYEQDRVQFMMSLILDPELVEKGGEG
jgi:Tfp pilus assembly protein PilN